LTDQYPYLTFFISKPAYVLKGKLQAKTARDKIRGGVNFSHGKGCGGEGRYRGRKGRTEKAMLGRGGGDAQQTEGGRSVQAPEHL